GSEAEVAHHAAGLQRETDVRIAAPDDVLRWARSNDLVIFFSEHFQRFRRTWHELNRRGCNTLYAIDGILEWRNAWENRDDEPASPWTMRPVLCDKVACIGSSQVRVLNQWGNAGKTELVGLPRLDDFPKANKTPVDKKQPFRLLVTTAKWPGFTPEQTELVERSLQDLRGYLDATPEIGGRSIEVVWRLTGGLDERVGVVNQLNDVSGQELRNVLADVDAVITTPSTVMLEAMLGELPVCLLDYTNSPRYVDAAWSISAESHFAEVLPQMADPAPRRLMYQRALLEDALQATESASQRMAELAYEMIRIGHDCRAANRPVRFPAQILPPIAAEPLINPALLYPDRPELTTEHNVAEANALVGDSWRKIEELEARIALLEYELERAAEGFEKIAAHPVVAPLLKVRSVAARMGGHIAAVLSPRKPESETAN
ncbi:MAG: hypothetical protein ACR2NP_09330, partial [Pirellulaceae bacterium]